MSARPAPGPDPASPDPPGTTPAPALREPSIARIRLPWSVIAWPGLFVVAGLLFAVSDEERRSTVKAIVSMRPLLPYLIMLLALGAVAVFVLPPWAVRRRTLGLADVSTEKKIEAENSLRSALFQAIGSALLVLGFVVTWQQLDQSRDQAAVTNSQTAAQLELTRNGQVAERFARAMEQLGSDKADVRIGGIYALESLLEEFDAETRRAPASPAPARLEEVQAERRTTSAIIEILTAYAQSRTTLVPRAPARATAPDVQAVLTILGRHASRVRVPVSLAKADLRGYKLAGCIADDQCARFDKADFTNSDLSNVDFIYTRLETTVFVGANLEQARLQQAQLTAATFAGARLGNTNFSGANLSQAVLQDAMLTETNLRDADLTGANLCNAKLIAVDLSTVRNLGSADLEGATADTATIWPSGFNWRQAGVRMVDNLADIDQLPPVVCNK